MTKKSKTSKAIEVWHQDNQLQDLWHGDRNIMINTAALEQREAYFEVIRIPSASFIPLQDLIDSLALN